MKTLEEAGQIDPEELARFKTDPEYFEQKMKESFEELEEMAALGPQLDEQFAEYWKMMEYMPPEEMEKQIADAMQMLQSGDMMHILKTLEEAGQIDPKETARIKTDPEYVEQQMKETFGQMQDLFSDPEVLKQASEYFSDMFNNPGAFLAI